MCQVQLCLSVLVLRTLSFQRMGHADCHILLRSSQHVPCLRE